MKKRYFNILAAYVAISMAVLACSQLNPIVSRTNTPEPTKASQSPTQAPTVPQSAGENGPKIITGNVTYTNTFFTSGVAEPEVILEDQGGFVIRDRKFLIPIQSQVIGEITSDFYTSPFTYSLSLPAEPNGTLRDVNHDNKKDTGVMVFAIAYWTNTWGDPYLDKRDQGGGGWSTAYASTKVSDDRDNYREVYGGKYVVYSPDNKQQFPSGFGTDKKLFTDDDPLVNLAAGWSVIDLDQTPFAIDRSEKPTIDLLEPQSAALDDFSKLSYTDAFDKMVDKFKKQYAWTELKKIDWDAKAKEFRPRFEDADKNKDKHAYALALRDFLWSIPDTHVGFDESALQDDFTTDTAGGVGFAMRETDDGKIIANFILKGGPAEKAGMKWGAEITELDGKPVSEAIDAAVPWSSPFSNPANKRLQQLRYALRFKMDKGQVEIKFKNPNSSEKTAKLDIVQERDSFSFSSFNAGEPATSLPVDFKMLPSGYGYIKISSFLDNDVLSIQVWERAIKYFIDNKVPGVILDMRHNGGGNGWLADQMAAYFFDKEIVVGNTARYNLGSGSFFMDPGDETSMIPPQPGLQYSGPVVVLVGPACASACEFFSYDMTINSRATVVGQYPSEGAGGSVEDFMMPENTQVQLTTGRAVDAQGNIHLEGKGVTPSVKVPVTAETLQQQANGEDVVLDAAQKAISQPAGGGIAASAPPTFLDQAGIQSAIDAQASQLEALASEQYSADQMAKMDSTFTYTIALQKSETLLWAWGWCAKDKDTLDQNMKNIKVAFKLEDTDVPLDKFIKKEGESGGQSCVSYFGALADFQGGESHVTTIVTFTAKINDGTADYPAGKQTFEYTVVVKP